MLLSHVDNVDRVRTPNNYQCYCDSYPLSLLSGSCDLELDFLSQSSCSCRGVVLLWLSS